MFKLGDRVRRSDITAESIPAFKAARGKVIQVDSGNHPMVRVHWEGDKTPEVGWRTEKTIEVCNEGE
jgi:hypothetical protein